MKITLFTVLTKSISNITITGYIKFIIGIKYYKIALLIYTIQYLTICNDDMNPQINKS